ncbi:MAG: hypothetical protein RI560_12895, partial [Natronomonas sp.]|nr:hypothetical protein [Natronomonas sp.]
MSRIIVLGWDALDLRAIERFGLGGAFGAHRSKIDTYVNPVVGSPHTKELWPSMITGLHPDEHGVHAARDGGVNWDSDLLRVGSQLADGVIPDDLKTWLGRRLRENGAKVDSKAAAYYAEHGVETVFDRGGRAISIPNYRTPGDTARGLDSGRDDLWQSLSVKRSGEGMKPTIDREAVYNLLGSEVGARLGETIQAVASGEPLVWTWFGLLDTVGHMQPALGDDFAREWYEVAAGVTETVRRL